MLVYAYRSFRMIGYTYLSELVSCFKKELKRNKIICNTCVSVICDEKDVESEINKAIKKELSSSEGWGINFEGWSSYDFSAQNEPKEYYDKNKEYPLIIEYIKDWTAEKIFKKLTMEQVSILLNELSLGWNDCITKLNS